MDTIASPPKQEKVDRKGANTDPLPAEEGSAGHYTSIETRQQALGCAWTGFYGR